MSKFCQDLVLEELEEESTWSSSHNDLFGVETALGFDNSKLNSDLSVKKVGRREAPTTQMFAKLHTKNGKPLKKEYVRCQIIRGIKKCARYMVDGRKPQKGIHMFNLADQEKMRIWHVMEQMVTCDRELFNSLGSTCEGPATDGKVIRKRQRLETPEFRSFNDDYCKHFYMQVQVRQFHFYYLQLVYGTGPVDPKSISEKLSVFCCGGCHTVQCASIWEQVRRYVMFDMIHQLGLEPFGTCDDFQATMLPGEEEIMDFDITDPDSFLA